MQAELYVNSRVLVVDDDPFMARTLCDILRLEHYEADTAFSGPEALRKMAAVSYGCVVSDIRMPGMNGLELQQAIKVAYPRVVVVLMTAYAADELIQAGLESGVLAVLNKPVDIDELLLLISGNSALHVR
jgi:CheY-like chemotaxis protein